MNIRTLENTTVSEITATFNAAFESYFIPLVFTEESMATKIRSEGIQLNYSVGAFENNKLVGFILHGYDVINGVKTIYNAGTGVVATHRGRGITEALYNYVIPLLANEGIYSHQLEVIDNNLPAKHVYEKLGFTSSITLQAFRGKPLLAQNENYVVRYLDEIPEEISSFANMEAAWQNSLASVQRDLNGHRLIGVYAGDSLVGFAAFIPATGRIKQLLVHPQYRRQGIGKTILSFVAANSTAPQLVVTNVDESYKPAFRFLQSAGFEGFLRLYEMRMQVNT